MRIDVVVSRRRPFTRVSFADVCGVGAVDVATQRQSKGVVVREGRTKLLAADQRRNRSFGEDQRRRRDFLAAESARAREVLLLGEQSV
jgi:hypothetical protein